MSVGVTGVQVYEPGHTSGLWVDVRSARATVCRPHRLDQPWRMRHRVGTSGPEGSRTQHLDDESNLSSDHRAATGRRSGEAAPFRRRQAAGSYDVDRLIRLRSSRTVAAPCRE